MSILSVVSKLDAALDQREISLFRGTGDGVTDLAAYLSAWHRALRRDEKRGSEYDEATETLAARFGGLLAKGIHLELHKAYDDTAESSSLKASEIDAVEQSYNDLLALSNAAAKNQSSGFTEFLLNRLHSRLFVELQSLLTTAGQKEIPADHVNHARACDLVGRTAMLAAFLPQLRSRLSIGRLRNSTRGIAERRAQINAERITSERYVTTFSATEPGERVTFVGEVLDAQLVNRPEKPYTRLWITQTDELRVSYKNTRWLGIGDHQSVWVRCKVEPPLEDMHYAVAEFEGPTATAGSIWESWIQQEVRDYYDLAPESIHWFCSFPPLASSLSPLNLSARSFKGRSAQ